MIMCPPILFGCGTEHMAAHQMKLVTTHEYLCTLFLLPWPLEPAKTRRCQLCDTFCLSITHSRIQA